MTWTKVKFSSLPTVWFLWVVVEMVGWSSRLLRQDSCGGSGGPCSHVRWLAVFVWLRELVVSEVYCIALQTIWDLCSSFSGSSSLCFRPICLTFFVWNFLLPSLFFLASISPLFSGPRFSLLYLFSPFFRSFLQYRLNQNVFEYKFVRRFPFA